MRFENTQWYPPLTAALRGKDGDEEAYLITINVDEELVVSKNGPGYKIEKDRTWKKAILVERDRIAALTVVHIQGSHAIFKL